MKIRNISYLLNFEIGLFLLTLIISSLGLITLFSADANQVSRQGVMLVVAIITFFICAFIPKKFWKNISPYLFIICLGGLVYTLTNGVTAGGAARWVRVFGTKVQISEFSKVILILAVAKIFSLKKFPKPPMGFKNLIIPGITISIISVLILKQPDLGTALCHIFIGSVMLFAYGVKKKTLIVILLSGLILATPTWIFILKDYQKSRVINFLNPEGDPLGSGYHAIQSKIAVGSGSLMGKGYMEGTQTQLRFLPEQTTDFIFSVFAEEWGFWASASLLLLYYLLISKIFSLAHKSEDLFAKYYLVGLSALIFFQVFVNVAMATGVFPVVGLTLPLFSYGGSSLLTIWVAIGVGVSLVKSGETSFLT